MLIISFLGLFISQKADAQTWVEPNCDPSAAEGPEACAVAAPLNTSDDNQTKGGNLTINGIEISDEGIYFSNGDTLETAAGYAVTIPNILSATSSYLSATGNPISGSWEFANPLITNAINANAAITITGSYFTLQNASSVQLMKMDASTNTFTVGGIAGAFPGIVNITNGTGNRISLTGSSGIISTNGSVTSPYFVNNNGTGDVTLRGGNGTSIAGNVNITAGYSGAATSKSITLNAYDAGTITVTPGATSGQFNITGSGVVNIARPDSTATTPALTINNADNNATAVLDLNQNSTTSIQSAVTIDQSGTGTGVAVNSATGTAISGTSNTGLGIYGNTTLGTGTSTGGVKGCYKGSNCGTLGSQKQAGVFEGDTYAWGDVIGSKFLPTNMQYSPYPYLQNIVNSQDELVFYLTSSSSVNYQVLDMVWDGSYMWMTAERSGTAIGDFVVLKVKKEGVEITDILEDTAYTSFNPKDMVDTGEYLGFVDENTTAPFSCNMLLVDKKKMAVSDFFRLAYPTGCENIVTDGDNLIIPVPTTDSGFLEYGDKIYVFNIDNLQSYAYINFSDNSLVCHNPTYIFYDGYNLWSSCSTTAGSEIPNAIIKITNYSCTTVIGGASCTVDDYELYNDYPNIDKLFFDGGYLWVTYSGGSTPLKKLDPNHTTVTGSKTYLNIAQPFNATSVNLGITDIDFDGANIWLSNFSTYQTCIIPAYGPNDVSSLCITDSSGLKPLLLEYDGMNMWNSFTSTANSYDPNGINIWSTSNGNFSSESNSDEFRGIKMTGTTMGTTAGTTEKYCLIVDESSGPSTAHPHLISQSLDSTNYDKYCAE